MAATDNRAGHNIGADSPPRKAIAITPHDSNELSEITRAIYVAADGDLVVVLADSTVAITFTDVKGGQIYPMQARIVKSTGTDATPGLVGLL